MKNKFLLYFLVLFVFFLSPIIVNASIVNLDIINPTAIAPEYYTSNSDTIPDVRYGIEYTQASECYNIDIILIEKGNYSNIYSQSTNNICSVDPYIEEIHHVYNFPLGGVIPDGEYDLDIVSSSTPYDLESKSVILDSTPPVITLTDLGPIATSTPVNASVTDDTALTYSWSQVSGPGTVTFDDNTLEDPSVSANIEGTYTIELAATDHSEPDNPNTGFTSTAQMTFVWDETNPSVTLTTPNSSDIKIKGGSTYDITWNLATDDVSANSSINIKLESSSNGGSTWLMIDASEANDGTYSWAVPTSDGSSNKIRVTAVDEAENTFSDISANNFIIDSSPPTVNINSVGTYINDSTPTIIGTTSDLSNVNSVQYKVDSGSWLNCSGTSSFSCTTTTLSEGAHTVYIRATDEFNHVSSDTANNVTFTVDTTPPAVNAPNITNSIDTATQSGATASDTGGSGINNYSWNSTDPEVIFSNSSALDPYISASIDGTYSATLTVTDNAGNVNSDSMTFTWDTDSIPPSITIDDIPGFLVSNVTSNSSPDITGNATDASSNISTVEYSTDGGTSWSNCSANDGAFDSLNEDYTCALSLLTDGSHTVYVRAQDSAGNQTGDIANSLTFTVDTIDPVVTVPDITTPINTSTVPTGITVVENGSGVGSYMWYKVSGSGTVFFDPSISVLEPTISASADDLYTLELKVTDYAGNQNTDTMTFTWDATNPTVSIDAVTTPTNDTTPTITGTASDVTGTVSAVEYKVGIGGTWTACTGTSTFSCTTTTLTEGTYDIYIRAQDDASNWSDGNDSVSITIDTTAPTVTTPNLGTINTATASGATASDANGIASYSWAKLTGPGIITFSLNNTTLNPDISADTDGTYSAELTVTDNAGNTNSSTMTFTWDATNPTVNSFSPLDGASAVAVASNLSITFSEIVNANTGNVIIKNSDGTTFESIPITDTRVTGSGTNTITINPYYYY
jgi:hypothetical protein